MFTKILIANRGEIACRIIRTARRMGIATVAVYSEADRDALHVAMADEAVAIGPAPAADSYLRADRIVAACLATGAQGVHPGYGFLSERAAFARAVTDAGLVFIGPNAQAIDAMGDKIRSKQLAAAAGVSTVPGSAGVVASVDDAVRVAREIGFPVMIKASAGGGGKGMRIAHAAADVAEGFARARSEAASSFGDDRIFLEKFIVDPRHIEIQVFGDTHGHIVHFGERECSIQRRNQKVVEEAPSPLLTPDTRRRMGAEAIALARAVGYDSAGTVEFVAGQDQSFYFLEMNTRLQVEHPVTELVYGVDLVEQMIRVAAGEPLRHTQDDILPNGWAVETRIYAEDPTRDFVPSVGRLTTYRPPHAGRTGGATVRIDAGVVEGGEVSIFYDPMIAKLVTHAATREGAIAAQADALDAFALDGIRHNIPFLSAVMAHPRWHAGALSTGFIAEEFRDGFTNGEPDGSLARLFAALAGSIDYQANTRKRRISGQLAARDPVRFATARAVRIGSEWFHFVIESEDQDGTLAVRFTDGGCIAVRAHWHPGLPVWHGIVDGQAIAVSVWPVANGVRLRHRGVFADARVYSEREAQLVALMPVKTAASAGKTLLCPMPGLVRSIDAVPGQVVKAGEPLAVIEAMKMENVLRAERDGTIARVLARAGDSLAVDTPILEFE